MPYLVLLDGKYSRLGSSPVRGVFIGVLIGAGVPAGGYPVTVDPPPVIPNGAGLLGIVGTMADG